MNEPKRWVTTTFADPDDPESLLIEFSDEMLESVGWKPGDILEWIIEDDGNIILRKKATDGV